MGACAMRGADCRPTTLMVSLSNHEVVSVLLCRPSTGSGLGRYFGPHALRQNPNSHPRIAYVPVENAAGLAPPASRTSQVQKASVLPSRITLASSSASARVIGRM